MPLQLRKFLIVCAASLVAFGLCSTAPPQAAANDTKGVSLSAVTAQAEGDMRIGSFSGGWSGFPVRYDVTNRVDNTWVFNGRIAIADYYDHIQITQYADNSLLIVRYLSGQYSGLTQNLRTAPPQPRFRDGVLYSQFYGRASGYHNVGVGDLWIPES